jgi:succinoglycan biosynthesis protein ExoW
MRIAVIIPYFQREPGILRQALLSVLHQKDILPSTVIVIDDSSPQPAEPEVLALPSHLYERVTLLHQLNAGPGAARNRGLDSVPPDTEVVVFLDSDDCWLPDHLKRATTALGQGFDFYFSNYYDIDATEGGFSNQGLLDTTLHQPLDIPADTYAYVGDIRTQILGRCPIETSTVAFRWDIFKKLRFRSDFRDAYEDLLFWFELTSLTSRVAFSAQVECRYGRGVNIFRGGTWGTEASLKRLVASTRFKTNIRKRFPLTNEQRWLVEEGRKRNRRALTSEILHRVRHLKPMLWRHLWLYFKADPIAALSLPPEIVTQLLKKPNTRLASR